MKRVKPSQAIFVKKHGPQVDADWQRIMQFHEATQLAPGIVAPQPLEKRSRTCEIVYAKLDCSMPIYRQGRRLPVLFKHFGAALYEFHSVTTNVSSNPTAEIEALRRFGLSAAHASSLAVAFPGGVCHGDCWHGNVFCTTDGRFIILDPIPAPLMHRFMPRKAPGCIDLAYFCASLFLLHRLAYTPLLGSDRLNEMARLTLEGYEMNATAPIPMPAFRALCNRISSLWVEQFGQRLKFPVSRIKTIMTLRLLRSAFFSKA